MVTHFNGERLVKNLPDAYCKAEGSNNDKLFQIEQRAADAIRAEMADVISSRDIYSATGYSLDLFGELYGQPRNGMADEQYRFYILQKMAISCADCDYNSVVRALATMLNVTPDKIRLEDAATPGNVDVVVFPYGDLESVGITVPQAYWLVNGLLPGGVKISGMNIDYDAESALIVANAMTHSESIEHRAGCAFFETLEAETVTAFHAFTHNENYTLEVT